MKHLSKLTLAAALLLSPAYLAAQEEPEGAPSPGQIVDGAAPEEWVKIAPEDLLVMDLAPDAEGNPRRVVIQLMPAPFSQGWIRNIRKLAAAHWWDGTSINRVQDNYVVQWGDAGYDNPESGETEQKALPEGLEEVPESEYISSNEKVTESVMGSRNDQELQEYINELLRSGIRANIDKVNEALGSDSYAMRAHFFQGWPLAQSGGELESLIWPVHCYGMVGVGRNYSPDTGSGAELYTVIGHAPRHLDRNIALVGRIIEGMEHLSSLPRGKGQLGFYEDATKRVPIASIRLGSDLTEFPVPAYEYLGTEGPTFAKYADARANRRDPFFIVPAGGADICNIPVPVRQVPGD